MRHDLCGFGFGPIQAALFAAEARRSGLFTDVCISEVDGELVEAVRAHGDRYVVNVATDHGVETQSVEDVRLLNPAIPSDLQELEACLGKATEMVTSLPSVDIYTAGGRHSVASMIGRSLGKEDAPPVLIYTAENNNHAAEILMRDLSQMDDVAHESGRIFQCANTVIGKMSQVIKDPEEIRQRNLTTVVPGLQRAFLVESFNHILVSRCQIEGFVPAIDVFEEKPDLLPFEEAKLYGHNAIHTLLGFLGHEKGYRSMAQLRDDADIMELARQAFVDEAGQALIARHGHLGDPLFTESGFQLYADDLLARITNPWLNDAVLRIIRDPVRKLGYADRVFGPIRLCLAHGVTPVALAKGARAGIRYVLRDPAVQEQLVQAGIDPEEEWSSAQTRKILNWLWADSFSDEEGARVADLL